MTSPYGSGSATSYVLSGDNTIDALVNWGVKWGSGGVGTSAVVTYSFPQINATWLDGYGDGEPINGFQGFTVAQQNAARQALSLWSDVANITFQEVPDTAVDVGDIRFGFSRAVTNSPFVAWGYFPEAYPEAGDIWFDRSYGPNLQMAPGQFGFSTLLHEIGHAIGLDHPFDDGAGEPVLPASMDSNQYTIMAYDAHPTASVEAMSPMLLDILAIQHLYGANMTTRTGDDVYKFSASEQLRAIWDAGGIDTIDASNQTLGAIINLNEGKFSSIGRRNAGGSARDNIAIAYGVTIENAKGGSGSDKIFGNAVDNVLTGNAGNDTLDGGIGADTLRGGQGIDIYIVDNVSDVVDEQGNKDLGDEVRIATSIDLATFAGGLIERATALGNAAIDLAGNKAANILIGNAATNIINGGAGADVMKGGAGNDIYFVDIATDQIDEGSNKDSSDEVVSTVTVNIATLGKGQIEVATLVGTAAINATGNALNNLITGNGAVNALNGAVGNDRLYGLDGNDTLTDTLGNNYLDGGNGNDKLTGGAGNDTLIGGGGNDVMNGGAGSDTYFVDNPNDKVTESGTTDLNDRVIAAISIDLTKFAGGLVEHVNLVGTDALTVTGNSKNNAIAGNAGANILIGDLGNDVLDGGLGADKMFGGKGNDVYVVDDLGDVIDEQGNSDTADHVTSFITIDLALLADGAIEQGELFGVDAVDISGTAADNKLWGNGAANTLDGREGNDTLVGQGGIDSLIGGIGNDLLDGGAGDDTLTGGAGNDSLAGGAGADLLKGGDGNDIYFVDFYLDAVDEEGNTDTGDEVRVAVSIDLSTFAGGAIENATVLEGALSNLTGNSAANILTGNSWANRLDGGAGDDLLRGGEGGDIYIVDSHGDVIEEQGNDTDQVWTSLLSLDLTAMANGLLEDVSLLGGLSLDVVGNAAHNSILGNTGDNKLDGGAGNDGLHGGDGHDYLIAGTGRDYLLGGEGNDILVVNPLSAVMASGGTGMDTILLPEEGIRIDLRSVAGNSVQDIECIDMRNDARDDLQLDASAVIKLSNTTDQLVIRGEAGDYLRLGAGFSDEGDVTIDGVSYSVFKSNGATIVVEAGIELRDEAVGVLSLKDPAAHRITRISTGGTDSVGVFGGSAGDFNNDGIDDLVVGSTSGHNAWVAFGSPGSFPANVSTFPLSVPGVTITGDPASQYGYDVSGGSDINGDGISDLLFRNPFEVINGQTRGGGFVVFGNDSLASVDLNALQPSQGFKITAQPALGQALYSISMVSDFNGDGYDDFMMGAPLFGTVGQAFLVLGRSASPTGSIVLGPTPSSGVFAITGKNTSSIGRDVADAGDLNGDGYTDIVICEAGSAEIIYGRKGATMPSFLSGANSVSIAGPFESSEAIGDINGDGYADLALRYNGDSRVIFGSAANFTNETLNEISESEGFFVNGAISIAGDINADGYDDLLVRNAYTNGGDAAAIVYGHSGTFGTHVDFTQLGPNAALHIARATTAYVYSSGAAGDTDGDGFDDLFIGTPFAPDGGQFYHVSGADFRDEVDFSGTAGADNLVGTILADRIVSAQGQDTIYGGGGADAINAGQGNDELHVADNKFFRVDGGAGVDTLHLDYAGAIAFGNLDGNAVTSDRGRIQNVESLNVDNSLTNNLTLHLADVLDLDLTISNVGGVASLDNVLRIDGNSGDTLQMFKADGWGAADTSSLTGYAVYTYQAVKVAVDTDIAVSMT